MAGPLTYPHEIVIESTIDLPAQYDVPGHEGMAFEVCCELALVVIELVIGLLGGGS
jgi:hypothetical protein